ncbi:MAG: FlgD immunoglobulin-like domain containing protein [Fimbriimonadaceae bacterium]
MRRVLLPILLLAIPSWLFAGPSLEEMLKTVQFRSLGPAVTGGRIVDIEVHPSDPYTIYAASASGGLWKSTNNAITWKPIFDNQKTISIGDVAIAPSDPKTIWLGTGEHNNQRSAHYGDGVYKSTDAGQTWTNMGLPNSNRIGRIAIDPKNPNIVFVASMGYLYKPGGDKGVYKTTDGGKTWELVLKGANETTGFIELVIDPKNGRNLYAASMDRLRRPWNIRDSGPGTGLYRTRDAGKTWEEMKAGIPNADKGRIGLAIYPKNPNILYAVIITSAQGGGTGVYRTDDSGKTWKKVNEGNISSSSYYGQIRVDPTNPDRVFNLSVNGQRSDDGGKKWRGFAERGVHVDHHALWIDPSNPKRMLLGNDGGLYSSYDDGETWEFVNNLPIPQFYAVSADMSFPYNVMGGLQDNGAWHGPSRTRVPSGIHNSDWNVVTGGDGFYTVADWEDPKTVYTSSQFGGVSRYDFNTRSGRSIRPPAPQNTRLRANWMAPFFVSPHASKTIYWGAQMVFKSTNRGDGWTAVSPDLTTNNPEKIRGNVPHCTITTIDESPKKQGVLWAGTDDGNVWVTQDDGKAWTQVNMNIPGAPKEWWVSRVHASPHDPATAFVSYTGFREDDFTPMLWKTTDYGKTWTSIVGNLPMEQISVVKQDTINPDLLVVGTETGAHLSLDGGRIWNKLSLGLPTVAVQDLVIHPRDGDLILGTHGRGVYIADIRVLREASLNTGKDLYVYRPSPAISAGMIPNMFDPFNGMRRFTAPNPPSGSTITYYLAQASADDPKIEILDKDGKVVREITLGGTSAGLNNVNWNLRGNVGGGQGLVPAGMYQIRITVAGKSESVSLIVADWSK